MQFYEASLHINRIYALRHGYTFMSQSPDKYGSKAFRHASWMKLQMIKEALECCCQWAMYMDSDSFLVMQSQQLPIEAWLAAHDTLEVTALLGNMYPIPGRNATLRKGTGPVAVVSDNIPWTATSYYCAGNLLLTRTQQSFEILDYWFNKTTRLDPSTLRKHPWEQRALNNFVMHKYRQSFWVAPGTEMNSYDGEIIRHLYSPYGQHARTKLAVEHLKQVLRTQ